MFRYTYTVILKPGSEAAFAGLRLGDGHTEPVDTNEDGTEVYTIYVNRDIDVLLDQNDAVLCYTVDDALGA